MPTLLAYALLFTVIGAGFIFIHLVIGKFVRPNRPDAEKLTVYECGEPTIGSAWVQFDLRFYVVALLFVIFDVEMAFFFPWAVVFGKSNMLAKADLDGRERVRLVEELNPADMWREPNERVTDGQESPRLQAFRASIEAANGPLRTPTEREAGVAPRETAPDPNAPRLGSGTPRIPPPSLATPAEQTRDAAESFAWTAFLDILVFFGVLLVGFAYLWRRGDHDWVRSRAAQEIGDRGIGVGRESGQALAV